MLAGIVLLAACALMLLPAATAVVTQSAPRVSAETYELMGASVAPFWAGLQVMKIVFALVASANSVLTTPTPSS